MTGLPRIVALARDGAALSDVQAAAGKLWLSYGGAHLDTDGAVNKAVDLHWRLHPGADPYWAFLATRALCAACGETYKVENLALCPNCFAAYCYGHSRTCTCGHQTLG